jgi:23S rRNA (pseudouridine1915-N3)-methyltransferase
MEISILAVGKLRSYYREACDDYAGRLRRYLTVGEQEIREGRGTTTAVIDRDEASRLIGKLPGRAIVVALTRDGKGWSSTDLARQIEGWMLESRPVAFAIGGSTGLHQDFLAKATHRWSLGPLTLPHELARVVVYEQLYRACTILRGEPYHKGKV